MADIKIPELPAASSLQDTDLLVLEQNTGTKKVEKGDLLSDVVKTVNGELPDTQGNVDVVALPDGGTTGQVLTKLSSTDGDADWRDVNVLAITTSSFSSLPQTITNSAITSNMVVVNSVLSNPSAQTSDWTINTTDGSLTITGSISGSTTLTLYLLEKR